MMKMLSFWNNCQFTGFQVVMHGHIHEAIEGYLQNMMINEAFMSSEQELSAPRQRSGCGYSVAV